MAKTAKKALDAQATWMAKINRAKKVRKSWKDLFRVDLIKEYLDGKQNPGEPENEWITINKMYSHLKAQLPSLYGVDPYFYVKLKRSFVPNPMVIALYEQRGRVRQSYLNYLKDELKLKEKARLAIMDAHSSYGVLNAEFRAEMVPNPDAGKPMEDDEGKPLLGDDGFEVMEPEEIPINQRYVKSRIHPDDFLWDEDAGPLEDSWRWVAECVRMPLEDAKRDPRFNKRALKDLEGKGESKDDERQHREQRKKGDIKGRSDDIKKKKEDRGESEIVVAWKIWEIHKKRWHFIAEEAEIPLLYNEEYPKGIEKHPYSILRFTLRDDSPYPHPPLSPGLDPCKEYNLARSRLLVHRKRFNRKYLQDDTAFSQPDDTASKLESGGDGTVLRQQRPTEAPAIIAIQDAPLDQMGYMEIGFLNQDMIELFGGSHDESRGIAGAESATQASILDKRLEMKEGDSMSTVIDWIKEDAKKTDQLVQAHIMKDEAVRITGPQGEFWELVKATDYQEIEGEFEYTVNVGATIPRMPHIERAQWLAFLQLLGNFPQLMLSPALMKRMAEMHHIEDEMMLMEIQNIAKMMMSGQIPSPGASGSQAGVPEERPASAMGGTAGGFQSLGMPGAGNL
jgi:hypothetical protein